ncbi:hypothetical protein NP233_g4386 [Leucocoprinus birnbaumii]|uniref:Uncharacterized protein n=1 Tax=Leucocoprinus birnbaumii TaxID=56174 RepID=A0AAD5VUR7_9AGAR|nr:hypothetical protein NP233_g4386 [Leucocoprinus birnbaumii]
MAKKSLLPVLYDFVRAAPPVLKVNLKGKTVLIVGANTGIGFEAAQHFATMDPDRLILACRNKEKGDAAIRKLANATGYLKAELWMVDLAEFESVKAFADKALTSLERLDIVVMNAGISTTDYQTTRDGWELTLQTNDLSLSLLSLLLLPRMIETVERFKVTPRIVFVSSDLHYLSKLKDSIFESPNAFALMSQKDFCCPKVMSTRYLDSKLLNVYFTRALDRHLKERSVVVSALKPGFCYSELRREETSSLGMSLFERAFAQTAEEGSRQLIWASVGIPAGGLEDLKGGYVHLSRVVEPADSVLDEKGSQRENKLRNDLISALKDVDPRVIDVVNQHLK